ncbi:RIP metalloprotease RseP, partial [Rhizobium ruizarguesonis]
METLSGIYAFLMGNIVTFILVLSLLVFVHEMGHYLVGRWSG